MNSACLVRAKITTIRHGGRVVQKVSIQISRRFQLLYRTAASLRFSEDRRDFFYGRIVVKKTFAYERMHNIAGHTAIVFIKRPAFDHPDPRYRSPEEVFGLDPHEAIEVVAELQRFIRDVSSIEARQK